MLRKAIARTLILAAIALPLLPACSSDLGSCGTIIVATSADSIGLAVGDSARVAAAVVSMCPDKVGTAVDWTSITPNIVSVRATSDTSAVATALAVGHGAVTAAARTRSQVKTSILVNVH